MNDKFEIVKLPNLDILATESHLLGFYEVLGFDNDKHQSLNPSKVIMNLEDQKKAVEVFRSGFEEKDIVGALMLFMNNGPSGDESVEKGTVKLEDGWITK